MTIVSLRVASRRADHSIRRSSADYGAVTRECTIARRRRSSHHNRCFPIQSLSFTTKNTLPTPVVRLQGNSSIFQKKLSTRTCQFRAVSTPRNPRSPGRAFPRKTLVCNRYRWLRKTYRFSGVRPGGKSSRGGDQEPPDQDKNTCVIVIVRCNEGISHGSLLHICNIRICSVSSLRLCLRHARERSKLV